MSIFAVILTSVARLGVRTRGVCAIPSMCLVLVFALLVGLPIPAAEQSTGARERKLDPAKFANPPNEYRPVDCWWWENGTLTKERLTWQLEEMHAKGVGGTWLYPRFGASQPQSSEPGFWTDGWWDFVRHALDEHQRLGMVQYANDWLGRLDKAYFQSQLRRESKQHPDFVGHRLVAHFAHSSAAETLSIEVPSDEQVLTAVAYKLKEAHEDAVDDESRVDLAEFVRGQELKWEAPGPEWLVAVISSQPHDLNYLEKKVSDRWIDILYEPYRQQLGGRLGKSLVAYGPDERTVLGGNILYCDALRDRFEKEKGSSPLPDLAALFIDIGPRTDCVRCQYFDVMNTLLEENLYAPMAKWLHDQNMQHVTIATWGRENLLQQTSNYGDFPRMMKYFDMPGNEDSQQSGPAGAFIDTKMSSSMAHINGRSRVGLCAYWGMGWGYTQAENIGRTNVNYALGANLYNTHGVLYSLLAARNEWVPPEIHFYQPYWQTWRTFSDYVSRLSYVLSQGQHQADVALIYPLSTIHAHWRGGEKFEPAAQESQSTTFALAKALYANSLDFDFVDEARLTEAEIEPGKMKINALEFPVVVLPSMTTIRADAVAHLSRFVAAGGTLVVFQQPPTSSAETGRDDPLLQQAWQELLGADAAGNEPIVERRNDAGGRTILVRSSDTDVTRAVRAAISPDVTTTVADLPHTHQQIGNQHVYYFVNRQAQPRSITVTVRAQGRPDIWDARTGKIHPLYRFRTVPHGTEIRLAMEPQEGVVVVIQAEGLGPQLVADNLSTVQSIEQHGNHIEIAGTANTAENLQAKVSMDGRVFSGSVPAAPAVPPLGLARLWECEYRPTMNNKWGDFRYPAADEWIGPEAPRMKYRAESAADKERPKWEAQDLNDKDWQQVTCTFGPYWQVLEPLAAKLDSDQLRQRIVASAAENAASVEAGETSFQWRSYTYSWKFGADRADVHQVDKYGLGPVSPNFLVFDAARGGQPVVHYLRTRVFSPREQTLHFDFGGQDKAPARQAWLNGELVVDVRDKPLSALPKVSLKNGWNQIVLRLVHAGAKPVATFAVLHSQPTTPDQPRFMPLSRWQDIAPGLIYDSHLEAEESIGWYRFLAPPGAQQAKLNLAAKSVEAWVNGEAVKVVDDTIQFPKASSGATQMSQVALRVHHKTGCYDGAAFQAPVAFKSGRGQIELGDWSKSGLAYYSGGVKYIRHVHLDESQKSHQVVLDLGDMRTSAEVKANGRSLGVRLGPPFTFDLTEAVHSGDNEIEVEVLNTLANYMSAGPTKYVYPGQTVSGLLGPVTLRFIPQVRIQCRPVQETPRKTDGETG
jgi:hypothetical protein